MADEPRDFLRAPIPEIAEVARALDDAVTAHLMGDRESAARLFKMADNRAAYAWTDSLWGKGSTKVYRNVLKASHPELAKELRYKDRNPSSATRALVHARDGYYCRFCGNPVVRAEVRKAITKAYPVEAYWDPNVTVQQHGGLQCLWAQYDHLFPWQRGGTSEIDNIILTCAGCNYGKDRFTIEELGLTDPFDRPPVNGTWDGLERFLTQKPLK